MIRVSLILSALALAGLIGAATPTYAGGQHSASGGFPIAARPNGFEEVPSILSGGNASFFATVNQQAQTITFKLTFSNLSGDPSSASINFAQRGVNGGVVAFICGGGPASACPGATSGTVTGTITASDVQAIKDQGVAAGSFQDLVQVIISNNGYVNITTADFPTGELRGQIVP